MTRTPGRRGISLLEGVFATGTFVFFFFAITSVWPTTASAVQQANQIVLATNLVQQQMEICIKQGYSGVASVPLTAYPAVTSTTNGVTDSVTFSYQVTVTPVSGTTDSKDVVVKVSWNSGREARSVTQESIVCQL